MARTAPDRDRELAAIEAAMVRIGRRQTRRVLGRVATEVLPAPVNLDQVAVLDAVEDGLQGPDGEVTVGDVAQRLGIDPSRASRVVAGAVEAGYLRRIASQRDGRRICLTLSEVGQQVLDHAHRSRQALIGQLLADWSARDRAEFARLLTRFTDALLYAEHG